MAAGFVVWITRVAALQALPPKSLPALLTSAASFITFETAFPWAIALVLGCVTGW